MPPAAYTSSRPLAVTPPRVTTHMDRCSTCLIIIVCLSICGLALPGGAPAAQTTVHSAGLSVAHELPVPSHVIDMVPADPPVPAPPAVPKPGPEPKPGPAPKTPTPPRPASVTFLNPEPGDLWHEGDKVTIRWKTEGTVTNVRFYYYGNHCALGGAPRGRFEGIINDGLVPSTGETKWRVPWLDGTALNLRVAGYDQEGVMVAETERKVALLPREFTHLPPTCIAISKRLQRLIYFEDGEVKRMHIISTAAPGFTTPTMRPGAYGRSRGQMGKIFNKALNPFSTLYRVHMPYWMAITASGSHGIHATSPALYGRLGHPASHGCVRQHRADARILYEAVSVGTPVFIF